MIDIFGVFSQCCTSTKVGNDEKISQFKTTVIKRWRSFSSAVIYICWEFPVHSLRYREKQKQGDEQHDKTWTLGAEMEVGWKQLADVHQQQLWAGWSNLYSVLCEIYQLELWMGLTCSWYRSEQYSVAIPQNSVRRLNTDISVNPCMGEHADTFKALMNRWLFFMNLWGKKTKQRERVRLSLCTVAVTGSHHTQVHTNTAKAL